MSVKMGDEAQVVRILINEAVDLKKKMAEDKKKLDQLEARIQTFAFGEIANKNTKFSRVYGDLGHANVAYKIKFKLLNYDRLYRAVGEIAKDHIKRTEAVEYDVENGFKSALIAVAEGDYSKELTVVDVLRELGLDNKQIKSADKRLRGVYAKDKEVLESYGIKGEREEELDAIRRYRLAELVDAYFSSLTPLQLDEIRRSIHVEQELAIGLEYEK